MFVTIGAGQIEGRARDRGTGHGIEGRDRDHSCTERLWKYFCSCEYFWSRCKAALAGKRAVSSEGLHIPGIMNYCTDQVRKHVFNTHTH